MQPRRLLCAAALGVAALLSVPVHAQVVMPVTTWTWATSTDITAGVAVRPDGYLVISSDRYNNDGSGGDGYLHLIPPWGGSVSPANRLGPVVDMIDVVYFDGSLYGISWPDNNVVQPSFSVVRLDATTGARLATLGPYSNVPGHLLSFDPLTRRLVMPAFDSSGNTYLIEIDPHTGARTTLMRLPIDPDEVTISRDGSVVWTAFEPAGINAYDRSGTLLYTLPNASSAGGLVEGKPGTCMQGKLFFTDDDANVYYVDHPSATSRATVPLITGSANSGWGRMTADPAGDLVVSEYGAYLVACPGFVPPTKPIPSSEPTGGHRGPGPAGGRNAPHSPGGPGSTPNLPQPPGPQSAPQAAPQPPPALSAQPAAAPGAAPSAVHSVVGSTSNAVAPNVTVSDVPQERPVFGFSALFDPTRSPLPLLLVATCLAAATLGAVAVERPGVRFGRG